MEFRDEAKLHEVTVAQNEVDLQMLQTVCWGSGESYADLGPGAFLLYTQWPCGT